MGPANGRLTSSRAISSRRPLRSPPGRAGGLCNLPRPMRRNLVALLAAGALAMGPAAVPASGSLILVSATPGSMSGNRPSNMPSIARRRLAGRVRRPPPTWSRAIRNGPDLFVRDIARHNDSGRTRLPAAGFRRAAGRVADRPTACSPASPPRPPGRIYLRDLAGPSSTRIDIAPPGVTFAHSGSAQAVTQTGGSCCSPRRYAARPRPAVAANTLQTSTTRLRHRLAKRRHGRCTHPVRMMSEQRATSPS